MAFECCSHPFQFDHFPQQVHEPWAWQHERGDGVIFAAGSPLQTTDAVTHGYDIKEVTIWIKESV